MILFWKSFCLVVVWFFVASLANATYPLFVVLSEAFETVFQSMDSDQDRGIDEGEFVAYFGVQSAPAEQPPEQSQEAEQPEEGQAEQGKGSAGEQLLLEDGTVEPEVPAGDGAVSPWPADDGEAQPEAEPELEAEPEAEPEAPPEEQQAKGKKSKQKKKMGKKKR